MIRTLAIGAAALTLVSAVSVPPAAAQDGTLGGALLGGLIGAGIGGAATGRAGGALVGGVIGAGVGATIGAEADRRYYGNGYFWSQGRCWYQYPNGAVVRVARNNCY
jgi:hypothetical protein